MPALLQAPRSRRSWLSRHYSGGLLAVEVLVEQVVEQDGDVLNESDVLEVNHRMRDGIESNMSTVDAISAAR